MGNPQLEDATFNQDPHEGAGSAHEPSSNGQTAKVSFLYLKSLYKRNRIAQVYKHVKVRQKTKAQRPGEEWRCTS